MNNTHRAEQENNEVTVARINQRSTIISSTITVISSIVGSIIVAVIVGNLTIKASLDAVKVNNKFQETQLQKTIETQLNIASETNTTQLEIAMKTIQNALDIIERDNELKLKNTIDDEKRKKKSRKIVALNYYLSDIVSRTLYIDSMFGNIERVSKEIPKLNNSNIDWINSITELDMKNELLSGDLITWEVPKNINEKFYELTPSIQKYILFFYKAIEKFQHITDNENKQIESIKIYLYNIINRQSATDKEKQFAYNYYYNTCKSSMNGSKYILVSILQLGFKASIAIQNELGIDDNKLKDKLKDYQGKFANIGETYYSSKHDALDLSNKLINKFNETIINTENSTNHKK